MKLKFSLSLLDFSHLHSRDRANPRVIEPQGSSKAQLLRQLSRSILFLPSVLARISHQRRRTHLLLEQTCRQRLPGVVINNQTQPNQRKVLYFSSPPPLRFSLFPFHPFYVFVVFRPLSRWGKLFSYFGPSLPPGIQTRKMVPVVKKPRSLGCRQTTLQSRINAD